LAKYILILGLPASKIMDPAWPWTMHKAAAEAFRLCVVYHSTWKFVQYSKLQHWCAAMTSIQIWLIPLVDENQSNLDKIFRMIL
jgi:hypothetical protein